MGKILLAILTFIFYSGVSFNPAWAITDPLAVSNNRFGIHVIDANDFDQAASLVNSTGGDWGYVTVVIREDDRDPAKWQQNFDRLRRLHLIPIVRLATSLDGQSWRAPAPDQADSWADFLSRLNWVIQNRYIILFNEPNHAKEWGGSVKPEEFAAIITAFSQALKARSPDFFILPGAVDSASPNGTDTMSASHFYKLMHASDPSIFKRYDGLASHSYPHPNFIGPVSGTGPGSITAYRWEVEFLKTFGLKSALPVFITETGWVHRGSGNGPGLSLDQAAANYRQSFAKVWTDANLVAVTPFVLKYPAPPFQQFSWIAADGTSPFSFYSQIQSMTKTKGLPERSVAIIINQADIPLKLVVNSAYTFPIQITNRGQAILENDTLLEFNSGLLSGQSYVYRFQNLEPNQTVAIPVNFSTSSQPGPYQLMAKLVYQGKNLPTNLDASINVIASPDLLIQAQLWLHRRLRPEPASLKIYADKVLVKTISPLQLSQGRATISGLTDVIPNRDYRFTLSKPYYLPRSVTARLNETTTEIKFPLSLPLDFYPDGRFNLNDLAAFWLHPLRALTLLFS